MKAPIPTMIDFSIGFVTLLYALLGIKGILRSEVWLNRRKQYPSWKYYLRLMSQIIPVLLIGWLFFIVPILQNNSSKMKDAFGIWPAAMLFLTVIFLIGVVATVKRIYDRRSRNQN